MIYPVNALWRFGCPGARRQRQGSTEFVPEFGKENARFVLYFKKRSRGGRTMVRSEARRRPRMRVEEMCIRDRNSHEDL